MSLGVFAGDRATVPVLAALEKGKWRAARDLAKVLCKTDRSRYLPLLVEANAGLARDLISRGLLSDARTVLDHLKTFAPPDLLAGLEKEFSSPQGASSPSQANPDSGVRSGAAIVRLWNELLQIAAAAETGSDPGASDIAVIDDAVTAFSSPPPLTGDGIAERVAGELAAVHAACEATAEGRWDDASGALRPLPARSVFRHWRIFLRGVRMFLQGGRTEAEECFARLPTGGACALAAAVIRGEPSRDVVRPTARAAWDLASSGQPTEWAADIAAADAAWREGSWTKAKDALVKGLRGGFPCVEHGLAAALSEALLFLQYGDDAASESRLHQLDKFWDRLLDMEKLPWTWMLLFRRQILLDEESDMPTHEVFREVGDLLRMESDLRGANPVRDSQGWQWVGEKLGAKSNAIFPGLHEKLPVRDREGAVRAFERAKSCDPDNEEAWLGLLESFDGEKKKSNRNRLLDELVRRFPHNKQILVRAGAMAAGRGAFAKGLGYLDAARALDPLDPVVRSQTLAALTLQVHDAHTNGKDSESVWARIEPLLDGSPSCDDLASAKWAMRLRRALIDRATAPAARADAERMAPSLMEYLALEKALCGNFKLPIRADWQAAWRSAPATWLAIAGVFRVASFAVRTPEFKNFGPRHAEALFIDALNLAADGRLFTGDPAGALRTFVNLIRAEDSKIVVISDLATSALSAMVKIVRKLPVKTVNASLHLRILTLALQANSNQSIGKAKSIEAFERLVAEAEKSGDSELSATAAKLLAEFRKGGYDPNYEDEDYGENSRPAPNRSSDFGVDQSTLRVVNEYLEAYASGDTGKMARILEKIEAMGLPPPPLPPRFKPRAKSETRPAPPKSKSGGDSQQEFGFSFPP